jgi:hypothetical protein
VHGIAAAAASSSLCLLLATANAALSCHPTVAGRAPSVCLACMHACCCSVACTCCAELRCAQITGRTYALLCVHGRQFSALLHSCCACCWPNAAAAATWLTIACMHGGRSAQRMYANAHLSQMLRATQPSCKRTAAAVAVTRRHHMQGAAAQQHVCELGEILHSTSSTHDKTIKTPDQHAQRAPLCTTNNLIGCSWGAHAVGAAKHTCDTTHQLLLKGAAVTVVQVAGGRQEGCVAIQTGPVEDHMQKERPVKALGSSA